MLAKAELTVSHAGSGGGYTLARSTKHINTFDVICAIDGPLVITNRTTSHGSCEMMAIVDLLMD